MSCGLPREVLKWILSLDLSYAVKNPKRDFANGFLYAEILSRYYPSDVAMHSFENVASMERKKSNWALLEKLFKRKRIPIDRSMIEAVIAADGDAAVEVLQALHSFINSPSYEASKGAEGGGGGRDRGPEASTSDQADYVPLPGYQLQAQLCGQVVPSHAMFFGGVGAAAGSYAQQQAAAAQQQQQQQQQQAMYQQQVAAQQQQMQQLQNMHRAQQAQQAAMYQQVAMGMQAQAAQAGNGGYAAQAAAAAGGGGGYGQAYAQQQQAAASPSGLGPGAGGGGGYAAASGAAGGGGGGGYAAQLQPHQQGGAGPARAGRFVSPGRAMGGRGAAAPPAPAPSDPGAAAPPAAAGGGYAAAYALAYAEQMRQQAVAAGYTPDQQALVYQQALYQYQQQAAAQAQQGGGSPGEGGNGAGPSASPEREGLPYSRKPRPVDFKPYDLKDFEEKDYNVKGGRGYWQLGKLGPDLETEELQAKREAKERIKRMAEQVREENRRAGAARPRPGEPGGGVASAPAGGAVGNGNGGPAGAAAPPAPLRELGRDNKAKEPTARERALQFAKNIPKPEPKPKKPEPRPELDEPPQLSELEQLERQHRERQHEVDKIRAELARVL